MALPPGLPGFRFHPTDEELITYYLKPKLLGTNPDVDAAIAEVDFYKFDPWELPDKSKIKSRDRMWLFFCRRDYQNSNSKRVKRTTKTGFWKITGKELVIKDQVTKACIGKKRTLVFHLRSAGSGRVERTDWVMHEYFVESDYTFFDQNPYVICRLKLKGSYMADTPDGNGCEPRGDNITEVENPVALGPNSSAHRMVRTTNPALGAEGFDDRFARDLPLYSLPCYGFSGNEEVSELESEPLYPRPRYGFSGNEISLPHSVDFFPYLRQEQQVHGMVQTTNPALGAEEFDDRFAPSDEEVYQMLRSQPLYSPAHYGILYMEECMLVGGQAQTTNPALGAEGFDDRLALSNEEVSEFRSESLYSLPCYGFRGEEISLLPSVDFCPYLHQEQQRRQGLNSSAISFEDYLDLKSNLITKKRRLELKSNLIPKKKQFFPRMITSLKRCFCWKYLVVIIFLSNDIPSDILE